MNSHQVMTLCDQEQENIADTQGPPWGRLIITAQSQTIHWVPTPQINFACWTSCKWKFTVYLYSPFTFFLKKVSLCDSSIFLCVITTHTAVLLFWIHCVNTPKFLDSFHCWWAVRYFYLGQFCIMLLWTSLYVILLNMWFALLLRISGRG